MMNKKPATGSVSGFLSELQTVLAEIMVRSGSGRLLVDDPRELATFLQEASRQEHVGKSDILRFWGDFLAKDQDGALNLSLCFPYCAHKCSFCMCGSIGVDDKIKIQKYLNDLEQDILSFSPVFSERTFSSFSFVGGTPSLLTEAQTRRILACLRESFQITKTGLVSIECNPASVTFEKLRLYREFGINLISLGVQSLDARTLRSIHREYQDLDTVRAAVHEAKKAGLQDINLDLILGFHGEPLERFFKTFEQTAALQVKTITVNGLVPTQGYLKANNLSMKDYYLFYDDLVPKALAGLARRAETAGYSVDDLSPERGLWTFVLGSTRLSNHSSFRYVDPHLGGACSTLGFGGRSRSHLFANALYEAQADLSQKDAGYRLTPLSLKAEMVFYVLHSLAKTSRIDDSPFQLRFRRDFRQSFDTELKILHALGKVRFDESGVGFIPTRTIDRMFYCLFFLLEPLAEAPMASGKLGPLWMRVKKSLANERFCVP